MFSMITSRTYWADRAMQTFRYKLALLGILCASTASAQQPLQLSIDYYQQRIQETDARASALTYENWQAKTRNDTLQKQLEAAQAEVAKLKAENEKLKAPPKAADVAKP